MKILHTVEFYHPSVGGMQEVVKQISERLVTFGHDITIATTKLTERKTNKLNGVKIVEFNISGNIVRGLTGEIEEYKQFLLNSDFDIITNFAAQQWATDIMLPILDQIKAKKVNVPTGFSGLYCPEYKDYFEHMKIWMKKYELNIYLSENYRDIAFARENNITANVIVPNGACEVEFGADSKIDIKDKLHIPKDDFLILHVGSHTGEKGHAEAISIFKKAHLKKATLLIVGNGYLIPMVDTKLQDIKNLIKLIIINFYPRMNFGLTCLTLCNMRSKLYNSGWLRFIDKKRISVTQLSRAETIAAFQQADLFLFPSNVECSPLVLFEAMASRLPFLTTDVGNSAEIVTWSQGGILLPTKKNTVGNSIAVIRQSAKLLERLYYDPSFREQLRESGYHKWKEYFTWDIIAKTYESLYLKLIKDDYEHQNCLAQSVQ